MFRTVICAGCLGAAFFACASVSAETRITSGARWSAPGPETRNGDLILKIDGTVRDAVIGPAHISGARAFLWMSKDATVEKLRMQGVEMSALQREGVRIDGKTSDVQIRDFSFSMRSEKSPDFATGITVRAGKDIVLQDGEVAGFRTRAAKGKYPKGDGITAERRVDTIRIENVTASRNADAGFDLKAKRATLDGLTAQWNYRNFRFWGNVEAGRLTSINPSGAHIWVGRDAKVTIDHLTVRGGNKARLLQMESGASVHIASCDLELSGKARDLIERPADSSLTLGSGC